MLTHQNPFSFVQCNLDDFSFVYEVQFRMKHLFLKISQNLNSLKEQCQPYRGCYSHKELSRKEPLMLRKQNGNILKSISFFLTEISNDHQFSYQSITDELLKLLKFLGPMKDLNSNTTSAHSVLGNKCASPVYHLYHCHLDIRFWALVILFQIPKNKVQSHPVSSFIENVKKKDESDKKPLDLCIEMLLWDIILLTQRQAQKASLGQLDINSSGFSCSCSQELALSVYHTVEKQSEDNPENNFYVRITTKILSMMKIVVSDGSSATKVSYKANVINQPPLKEETISLAHCWWILVQLTKLVLYDQNGLPSQKTIPLSESKHGLKLLVTLVKLIDKVKTHSETEFRFYCKSCLFLWKIWDKELRHCSWVNPLWDQLSKNLNTNFAVKKSHLDEFLTGSLTSSNIIEQVKSIVQNVDQCSNSENSWKLLIRIIATVVKNNDNEWKSIKGRILCKFHEKKMKELNGTGLENTILLFLVLADVSEKETTSLVSFLCDMLTVNPLETLQKQKMILLGLLSSAEILLLKECDLKLIGGQVNKAVGELATLYLNSGSMAYQTEVGKLLTCYFEGVEHLISLSTNLNLSQSIFFCSCLTQVANRGQMSELKSLFDCLDTSLCKILTLSKDLVSLADTIGLDVVTAIWGNFERVLKRQCESLTPELVVGSIMASLFLCFSRFSSGALNQSTLQEKANGIVRCIMENNATSSRIALSFIRKLLQEEDGLKQLSLVYSKSDDKMVSLLLVSLIYEGSSSQDILTTARAIFSFPSIATLLPVPCPQCPFEAYETLFRALVDNFNTQSLPYTDRIKYIEKAKIYFGGMEREILKILKRDPLPEHIKKVYKLINCLFFYGHQMLYSRNSPNVLNMLLKSLVLPRNVFNEEIKLSATYLSILTTTLPKVICGLACLKLKDDPSAKQAISDIFTCYIHRFNVIYHPFLEVFEMSSSNRVILRPLFINTIKREYLVSNAKRNSARSSNVLYLLSELLSSDPLFWFETFVSDVFPALLELMINLKESSNGKNYINDINKLLFTRIDQHPSELRINLCQRLGTFIHMQLPWFHNRVFIILKIFIPFNRSVLEDILPEVVLAIKNTEAKRGALDVSIRKNYNDFLQAMVLPDNYLL